MPKAKYQNLDSDVVVALVNLVDRYGRKKAKSILLHAWESGQWYGFPDDDVVALQRFRNTGGPSKLRRVSLSALVDEWEDENWTLSKMIEDEANGVVRVQLPPAVERKRCEWEDAIPVGRLFLVCVSGAWATGDYLDDALSKIPFDLNYPELVFVIYHAPNTLQITDRNLLEWDKADAAPVLVGMTMNPKSKG
jgi:hypothetical protein